MRCQLVALSVALSISSASLAIAKGATPPPKKATAPAASVTDTSAKTNSLIGDKWAVVIGISQFADSEVPRLKYSAKDARDFADFLTDPNHGRFAKDHVKVLTNDAATKINIMDAIGDSFLPHAVLPGDLVVIYLSTHGSPSGSDQFGVNYIIPYDAQVNKLFATGIEMRQLLRTIKERVRTNRILLVLDTCYSGAGAETGHKGLMRTNVDAKQIAQGIGSIVISSSSPNERAWESEKLKNSFFTRYLIDSLQDSDGTVTIDQAFDKMKARVQADVLKDKGEMQTPVMGGNFQGQKLVLGVPAAAPHASPFSADDSSKPTSASTISGGAGHIRDDDSVDLASYAEHMRTAKSLESQHKFWDASHELDLSIKANSHSVEAYLASAKIYDSQGRYDQSLEAAKRAVVNDSNSSQAHEALGLALMRNNDATEALRQTQIAVTLDPDNSMAHNLLGYVNDHSFNRSDLAEQEYRRALGLNNLNVRALVNLGLLLESQNRDTAQAEDCFRKAISADADDWQAHLALAHLLYEKKGDPVAAEKEVRRAVELDPANPSIHRELANILAANKDHYSDAEAEYRKAVQLSTNDAESHAALGRFLATKVNRLDEAEKEFRQAVTLDPKAVASRVDFGKLLLAAKNYDEADVMFKKALEQDGRCAEARVGLATIFADLYHNYTGAQDELMKALNLNDKLSSAHEKLGEVYYHNMNRPSDAKLEFSAAIACDPSNAEAHFQLGMLLAQTEKTKAEEAQSEIEKAIKLNSENAIYETKLGWIKETFFKSHKEAEEHYKRAIALSSTCSEAHFRLGMLMIEKFGLRKSGSEELRIAYQQNPNDPEIKAAFLRFVGK
ncbi:MAG TPA: tetratricopeptide repeat protein [Oculatellaceae cyanobacterium]